jgi:hypothetical protein
MKLLGILVLTFVLGYWIRLRQPARVTAIDPESAEWQAAVARARATLPLLRELFPAHPEHTLVKVPVPTVSGSREHVWAQLRELGTDTLTAIIVTPLLNAPSGGEKAWWSLWRSWKTGMCSCPAAVSVEASRPGPRSNCAELRDSGSREGSEMWSGESSICDLRTHRPQDGCAPGTARSRFRWSGTSTPRARANAEGLRLARGTRTAGSVAGN